MSAYGNVAAEEGNPNDAFRFGCQPYHLPTTEGGGANTMSFPFTNAQWSELERQAMIFNGEAAQEKVAPCGGDSDRGRCKRTDGKKWRCSKDAAPDQKYCERHLHRGRPRSRKPVEILPNDNAKKTRLLDSSPIVRTPQPPLIGSPFSQIRNPNLMEERIRPRMDSCWITTDQVSFEDNLLRKYGECFFNGGIAAEEACDLPGCSWAAAPDTPGGPLAEVLHWCSSSSNVGDSATAASSPSGVLQKSMFSFSDSSGNSSPIPISNSSDIALMWLDQSRGNLASLL